MKRYTLTFEQRDPEKTWSREFDELSDLMYSVTYMMHTKRFWKITMETNLRREK